MTICQLALTRADHLRSESSFQALMKFVFAIQGRKTARLQRDFLFPSFEVLLSHKDRLRRHFF